MNSSSSNLMGYCTLAMEFFWLKNYTSYYYINSFSLLWISFFSLILFVASFLFFSHLRYFFFSLILSIASPKKKKRENESCWNVLECEGEKENKRRGGVGRDRLDPCVEEKNMKKEKEKNNENVWTRMNWMKGKII